MFRSQIRKALPVLSLLLLIAPGCAYDGAAGDDPSTSPDVSGVRLLGTAGTPAASRKIRGRYIVSFASSVSDPSADAEDLVKKGGGRLRHVYAHTIHGFAAELPDAAVDGLRHNPKIARIEEEAEVEVDAVQSNPGWALDRIDQAAGTNGGFRYDFDGAGAHVYVVDTGIRGDHVELSGRLGNGVNTYDGTSPYAAGTGAKGYHGTAVASLAAGTSRGVAKKAIVHSVKAGIGNLFAVSDLIAGLDWIGANAIKPAVVNSSHGGNSVELGNAYQALLNKGITVVRAAGNEHVDACRDYSNTVPGMITVGASTSSDELASFSNYGRCITLLAPGQDVLVATSTSSTATMLGSGTSYAAPLVAGMAAVMLGRNKTASPAQIRQILSVASWSGKLKDLPPETPNKTLNSTVTRFLPGTSLIYSGIEGDLAETYLWSADNSNESDTYKWERSINGGAWQTISTERQAWMTIQPSSQFKMKLRVTRSYTPIFTTYTELKTFDVTVQPTQELDFCNWKVCN